MNRLDRVLFQPQPLRALLLQHTLYRLPLFSYSRRCEVGAVHRPGYGYCVLQAGRLAVKLGYSKISVLEFGVAGGRGLVAIEQHVERLERELDLKYEVYGFDTGVGLPKPTDYRDLPYHWQEGFFRMEKETIEARLKRSVLILGHIRDTVTKFFDEYSPAPIGCVFFDMDYYSSTVASFDIFRTDTANYLPRVFCYFDDITGTEIELYNEFTGELLAINEFNAAEPSKKFAPVRHLHGRGSWNERVYSFHDFRHPRYNDFVSARDQQQPL
jgi:hypothetical protein